ncbi:MAG: methyl-accepting chemotaxis protein [Solirubrobacterales bacterium]
MHTQYSSSDELRAARLFPQWFKDLDAKLKPVVSALVLLAVAAPVVVYTVIQWRRASDVSAQIGALLADGGKSAQLAELTHQFEHYNTHAMLGIMVSGLIAAIGAMWIAYATSKLAAVWLTSLADRVGRAADGDLTTEIVRDNKSQIGDVQEALGKMIGSFNATVARIDRAAEDLREASSEMSGITDEAGHAVGEVAHSVAIISIGAGNQVELIAETSAEVGAIEIAVSDAARHAERVSEQSLATVALTEEGVRRAAEIEDAIGHVRDTGMAMAKLIHELGEKSTDIDLIVGSIADIAEQTNLLALNAAIEAARAGEQGRGFAVVAEEVRKLAEEAQVRADEIAGMTDGIRENTERAIGAVKDGSPTVIDSLKAVGENRKAFAEISGAAAALNDATEKIATLAATIANDASQVRAEIEDIASVAEESSASTEQVSAATEESSASAEEVTASAGRVAATAGDLARMVTEFKLAPSSDPKVRRLVPRSERDAPEAESDSRAKELRA